MTSKFIVGNNYYAKIEQSNLPSKSYDIVFAASLRRKSARGFESKAAARMTLIDLIRQANIGES